jgi:hypothetical protein
MITTLSALVLAGSVAIAQNGAGAQACDADVKSKCGDVQTGEHRLRLCVNKNFRSFSLACQAGLLRAAASAVSCQYDIDRYCKGAKPGEGRIETCIKGHLGALTKACRDAFGRAAAGNGQDHSSLASRRRPRGNLALDCGYNRSA